MWPIRTFETLAALLAMGMLPAGCSDDRDNTATDDVLTGAPFNGSGTATVTFADGTEIATSVTCTIGKRELAGRELLYTATSTSDVQLDLTIYGEGGSVDSAVLNLTEADGTKSSIGGQLAAGPFELTKTGTIVAGSGTFKAGHADNMGADRDTRKGDILVECS